MISIRATRALLGDVSDKTVRRLVKAGRIEAVKVAPVSCRGSPRSAASPEADDGLARRQFRQFRERCAFVWCHGIGLSAPNHEWEEATTDGHNYGKTTAPVIGDLTDKRFSEPELRDGLGKTINSVSQDPRPVFACGVGGDTYLPAASSIAPSDVLVRPASVTDRHGQSI